MNYQLRKEARHVIPVVVNEICNEMNTRRRRAGMPELTVFQQEAFRERWMGVQGDLRSLGIFVTAYWNMADYFNQQHRDFTRVEGEAAGITLGRLGEQRRQIVRQTINGLESGAVRARQLNDPGFAHQRRVQRDFRDKKSRWFLRPSN